MTFAFGFDRPQPLFGGAHDQLIQQTEQPVAALERSFDTETLTIEFQSIAENQGVSKKVYKVDSPQEQGDSSRLDEITGLVEEGEKQPRQDFNQNNLTQATQGLFPPDPQVFTLESTVSAVSQIIRESPNKSFTHEMDSSRVYSIDLSSKNFSSQPRINSVPLLGQDAFLLKFLTLDLSTHSGSVGGDPKVAINYLDLFDNNSPIEPILRHQIQKPKTNNILAIVLLIVGIAALIIGLVAAVLAGFLLTGGTLPAALSFIGLKLALGVGISGVVAGLASTIAGGILLKKAIDDKRQ